MDKKPQKGHAPFETPMVLCCFVRWGRSRPWAWRGHIDGVSHLWGVPAPLVGFPSISRASGLVVCGRFPATVDQVDQKGLQTIPPSWLRHATSLYTREALSLAGTGSQAPGGNAAHQGKALEGGAPTHREGGIAHRLARLSM